MALAGRQQTFASVPDPGTRQAIMALLADINDVRNAVTGGGSGPVTSFNSRFGAVVLNAADVDAALGFTPYDSANPAGYVTAASAPVRSVAGKVGAVLLVVADVSGAAPLASPTFTGVPAAPTAAAGTNTTQLASTAFVQAAVGASGVSSFDGRTGAVSLLVTDATGGIVGYANVKAYGAVGNGTTDDTVAIQAAINSGFPVYFPPGIYRITSALTATNVNLTLWGAGPTASIVKVDGAINGVTFVGVRGNYTLNQLVIENLAFLSNNTGALAAVQATWTLSTSQTFYVQPRTLHARNVMVSGLSGDGSFLRGFFLSGADNASIQHCYITTFEFLSGAFRASSAGIEMISTAAAGGFESDITDVTFLQCDTAIKYNADATATNNNCQGLFANHCHIINCSNGVKAGNAAAVPGGTTIEPEVKINNCFIGAQSIGVDIQAQAQWSITDNLFYNAPGIPNSIGVKATSANAGGYQVDGQVRGNTFINLGGGGSCYGVSVVGNAGAHESILIDANTFEAMTNSVLLDANTDSAQYTYTNLVISGGAASDLGTGNFVDAKGQTTPVPAAGAGAFTTVSSVLDYGKIGRFVRVRVTITITTNGTASSLINVAMPYTATSECAFYGRAAAVSGKMVQGIVAAGTSTLTVVNYDNTYPGATGERITLEGMIFV